MKTMLKKNQFMRAFIGGIGVTLLLLFSCNKSNNEKKGDSVSVLSQVTTNCLADFDFLVEKVRTNYPGYNDKITDKNHSQLADLEKEIRLKITNYPDSCFYYMNEYTAFFKDGHLGVTHIRSDAKGKDRQPKIMDVSSYGKNLYINVDSLQHVTENISGIEGVWRGYKREFLVTKDGKKYVGVVVNQQEWKRGQVLYEFEPVNDTVFNVIYHSLIKDEKTRETEASLHLNRRILEIHHDRTFVRKTDHPIFDEAFRSTYEPAYPNTMTSVFMAMALDDNTFFLRIPSFSHNRGNELVTKHWDEIMSRPNLIIDIRNNGGGSDNFYRELAKIIYTKPYEVTGLEYYATEDNIRYFEESITKGETQKEWIGWRQALIEAMKKEKGNFVAYPNKAGDNTIIRESTIYPMPRNVGIIINERNASSAEQFLLAAKESDKVTIFGNTNTAGVLDYSNVIGIPFTSNNYLLRCPTTRSKRVPENPFDNIGVAPDIIIPFPATKHLNDKLDNWIYFVKNYLEALDEEKKQ